MTLRYVAKAGLILTASVSLAHAGGQNGYAVSLEIARCIVENRAEYLNTQDDPVIIALSACPEADLARAMAQMVQNSAIPNVGATRQAGAGSRPSTQFIVYPRPQFACLTLENIRIVDDIAYLPEAIECGS